MNVLFSGLKHLMQQEDIDYLTRVGFNVAFKKNTEEFDDPTWPTVMVGFKFIENQPLQHFTNLRVLQLTSAGYNHLDLEYIKENKISLHNARGAHSIPIAEYVLGKILEVLKDSRFYQQCQNDKVWDRSKPMKALYQRRAAILGTGSIGQEIAKRLQVFEVETSGFNSDGRAIDYFDHTYPLHQFSDLAKRFDIVILALPLNEQTNQFMNKERLLSIQNEAILINIGRGQLINEPALIELLDSHFSAVILDVFEVEPLPQESPLWDHPKVIVTPHHSSVDPTSDLKLKQLILDNLTAYMKNEPLINEIKLNKE